ncbi:MAG: Sua5/YciO/YrdC/YwlC family protein [Candidatus Poseidoniales archaeon]|nr:MAG: Sua5/YciO/YrdC/YwlC family protein [Candidatus Poseidoniales archaeon]
MLSKETIDHMNNGGVVAYPTSTLPGLACLPQTDALDRLFELKQRPADKPVSLGVLSLKQAETLVRVPEKVRLLEAAFPKGGFTFILDAVETLDPRLGGDRVAVRCLAHPVARQLVETFGPITATSANESGETPADSAEAAGAGLGLPDRAVLPGMCPGGLGSTILNVVQEEHGAEVTVMREGIIPTRSVIQWWKNPT